MIKAPRQDLRSALVAAVTASAVAAPASLLGVPVATATSTNPATSVPTAAQASATRIDFNGDGYVDLAVGVPAATVGRKTNAGYVNVVWGGPSGLGSAGSAKFGQAKTWVPGTV